MVNFMVDIRVLSKHKCWQLGIIAVLFIALALLSPTQVNASRVPLIDAQATVIAEHVSSGGSMIHAVDGKFLVTFTSGSQIFVYTSTNTYNWSLKSSIPFNGTTPAEPQIYQSSDGKYIIVFAEVEGYSSHIAYVTSTDAVNWSGVSYIFKDNTTVNSNPSISEAFGKIWVAWDTNLYRKDADRGSIVISSFDANTGNWSAPTHLFKDNASDTAPHLAFFGGKLHIVFSSDRYDHTFFSHDTEDQIENDILYSCTNNGIEWAEPSTVVITPGEDDNPGLFVDLDGHLTMYYDSDVNEQGGRGLEHNVYYTKLNNGNWSTPTYLTHTTHDEIKPSIIQDRVSGDYLILYLKNANLTLTRVPELPDIADFQPKLVVHEGYWVLSDGKIDNDTTLNIHINEKATKNITIINSGKNTLRGKITTIQNDWLRTTANSFELLPGRNTTFQVKVDFDDKGEFSGAVIIESNAPENGTKIIRIDALVHDDGVSYQVPQPPAPSTPGDRELEFRIGLAIVGVIIVCAIVLGIRFIRKKSHGKKGGGTKLLALLLILILLAAPVHSLLIPNLIQSARGDTSTRLIDTPVAPASPVKIGSAGVNKTFMHTGENASLSVNGAIISNVSSQVPSDGLYGYWPMEESGWWGYHGEVKDASGNGHNGTAYYISYPPPPPTTVANGISGRAGYLIYNSGIYLDGWGSRSEFTFSAWVMLYAQARGTIFWSPFAQMSILSGQHSSITPKGSTAHYLPSFPSINNNEWVHVAMTSKSGETKLYLNGVQIGNTDNTTYSAGALDTANSYFDLAAGGFYGLMDEVRIYDRALSASEVASLATPYFLHPPTYLKAVCYDPNGNEIPIGEGPIPSTNGSAANFTLNFSFTPAIDGAYLVVLGIYDANNTILFDKYGDADNEKENMLIYASSIKIASAKVVESSPNILSGRSFDVYFINAQDAPGGNSSIKSSVMASLEKVKTDLKCTFNYHDIQSTSALENLIKSNTKNAIIVNTHGDILPIPGSYIRTLEPAYDTKALYRFEDWSMPTALYIYRYWDATPNGNDGELVHTPASSLSRVTIYHNTFSNTAKFGNYSLTPYYLTATDTPCNVYVTVPSSAAVQLQKFTVEFWIYPTAHGSNVIQTIVATHGHDAQYPAKGWEFSFRDGNVGGITYNNEVTFSIADGYGWYQLRSNSAVSLNQWHKVLGTYNGTEMKLIVDGELKDSKSVSISILYGNEPLTIGADGVFHDWNGRLFTGMIDDLMIRDVREIEVDSNVYFQSWMDDIRNFIVRNDNVWVNTGSAFSRIGLNGLYADGKNTIELGDSGLNTFLNSYGLMPRVNLDTRNNILANLTVEGMRIKGLFPSLSIPNSITYTGPALPDNYRNKTVSLYYDSGGNITPYGILSLGGGAFVFAGTFVPDLTAAMSAIPLFGRNYLDYITQYRYRNEQLHVNAVITNPTSSNVDAVLVYHISDPFGAERTAYQQNLTIKPGNNTVDFSFTVSQDDPKGTYFSLLTIYTSVNNTILDIYGDTAEERRGMQFNIANTLYIQSASTDKPIYKNSDSLIQFLVNVSNSAPYSQSFVMRVRVISEDNRIFMIKDDNKYTVNPNQVFVYNKSWDLNQEIQKDKNNSVPLGDFTAIVELYDGNSVQYANRTGDTIEEKTGIVDFYIVNFTRAYYLHLHGYDRRGGSPPSPDQPLQSLLYYVKNDGIRQYLQCTGWGPDPYHWAQYDYFYNSTDVYFMPGDRIFVAPSEETAWETYYYEVSVEQLSREMFYIYPVWDLLTDGRIGKLTTSSSALVLQWPSITPKCLVKLCEKLTLEDMGVYDKSSGISTNPIWDDAEKNAYITVPNSNEWIRYKYAVQGTEFVKICVGAYNPSDHDATVTVIVQDMNGNTVKSNLTGNDLILTFKFSDRNNKYTKQYTYLYRLPTGTYLIKVSSGDGNAVRITGVTVASLPTMEIVMVPGYLSAGGCRSDRSAKDVSGNLEAWGRFQLPTVSIDAEGLEFDYTYSPGLDSDGNFYIILGGELHFQGSKAPDTGNSASDSTYQATGAVSFGISGKFILFDREGNWVGREVEIEVSAGFQIFGVATTSDDVGALIGLPPGFLPVELDVALGLYFVILVHYSYPLDASAPVLTVEIGPQLSLSISFSAKILGLKIQLINFCLSVDILFGIEENGVEKTFYFVVAWHAKFSGFIFFYKFSVTYTGTLVRAPLYHWS